MNPSRALMLFLALPLLALISFALSTPAARAADPIIIRVTTSGTTVWPCGDQTNWSNPCAFQTALTLSVSGSELWVAAGTYKPTTGTDRTASFQLRRGVALYGGFAGTETLRNQRNFTANLTILSGDIGVPGDNGDNAYHVVTGMLVTNTAVLNGFTVTGGRANGATDPNRYGGGMYNNRYSSPTVANVTFRDNSAGYGSLGGGGGGMWNSGTSNPVLTNVTFSGNSAYVGGGMYNSYSSPILTNVTFISNTAGTSGGGMYSYSGNPQLTNVTLNSNTATLHGGGMYNYYSNPTLTSVTFGGNSASFNGGGIENVYSNTTLNNTTFFGNTANGDGGGIYNESSSPTIRNSILWGNTALNGAQIYDLSSTPSVSYSVVQNGYAGGTHILTADPRLGVLGYWGGSTQTIPLLPGSSAIDSADDAYCPATDQRGVPRPIGPHCDMGAFEYLPYSVSLPLIAK